MSRTNALKIGYVAALVVLAAVAGITIWAFGGSTIVILVVALALFLPGRIQGFFFRDLFRGRRLLAARDFAQSLDYSRRFLGQIRKRPWQKKLIWLSWAVYTTDVEAMALNNIAAAHLECGEWEQAENLFREAIERDAQYPLPFFNLAVIAELKGNHQSAQQHLAAAQVRGFTASTIDQVINAGQGLLARLEGSGVPTHGGQ